MFAEHIPAISTNDGRPATTCEGCSQSIHDDILIGTWVEPGKDLLEAHDRDVRKVLDLLKREEFIVGKWKLFVKDVAFCGHIL